MRWHRRAIPFVAQAEMADCGAAALAMTLGYHGRHVSLAEMHEATGTGRDGTNALQIAEAAGHARRLLSRSSGIGKVLASSVVVRLMALSVPVLTGVVVDQVVPAGDGHLLKVLAAVMAALIGYSVIATYLRAHLLLRLRSRLDVDMTLGFLEHLVDLPYAFFLKRSSGDLMMRLRSNATGREILTTGTIAAMLDGALATLYLVVIFALSPILGILVTILGAAQVVVLLSARRRNQHLMGEALATEAKSQSYAYEMFSAVETLKAAGAERRAVSHWSNLFVAELNVSLRRGRLEAVVETAIHGAVVVVRTRCRRVRPSTQWSTASRAGYADQQFRNRFLLWSAVQALMSPKLRSKDADTVLMVWQLRLAVLPDEDATSSLANTRSFAQFWPQACR